MMIIDFVTYKHELHKAKFTNFERVVSIILWPIMLIIIIKECIKPNDDYNDDNSENN
jgi:hypothetical protein